MTPAVAANPKPPRTRRLARADRGPLLLLLMVLAAFSAAVCRRASLAVAPPVYDGLSYYWKAITSLRALKAGAWSTLLGSPPSSRPPGYLLLNGAFGIDAQVFAFRGFLALNMILPVLLWSLACWIALPVRGRHPGHSWRRALAVAALALLPMFLQFEYSARIDHASFWGLQDTALAATASLAMALLLRSLRLSRLTPAVAGFALAGFCLLIKPAGVLVMLAVTGMWTAEALCRWWASGRAARRRRRALFFARGLGAAVVLQGVCSAVALTSPYLSSEIIAASRTGQAVVLDLTRGIGALALLGELLRSSFGPLWAVFLLLAVTTAATVLSRGPALAALILRLRLVFALLIVGAAWFWWVTMAGPIIRYMFPFVCLALILTLPTLWRAWQHHAKPRADAVIVTLLSALTGVHLALVCLPYPVPDELQECLGINLTTGGNRASVDAARHIVAASADLPRPVMVLCADSHYSLGFVTAWLTLENLSRGEVYQVDAPFAWKFDNVLSKAQFMQADFIALDRGPVGGLPPDGHTVGSFADEVRVVNAWLATLGDSAGVQRQSFQTLDVLRVVDRMQLSRAFNQLVSGRGYRWRPEFLRENADSELARRYHAATELAMSVNRATLGGAVAMSHHLDAERLRRDGECVPTGNDPLFVLAPIANRGATEAIVRLELSNSAGGDLQVFYCQLGESHREQQSLHRPVPRGDSECYLAVPLSGEATLLRLDPPGEPACTVVRHLSLRLTPASRPGLP